MHQRKDSGAQAEQSKGVKCNQTAQLPHRSSRKLGLLGMDLRSPSFCACTNCLCACMCGFVCVHAFAQWLVCVHVCSARTSTCVRCHHPCKHPPDKIACTLPPALCNIEMYAMHKQARVWAAVVRTDIHLTD